MRKILKNPWKAQGEADYVVLALAGLCGGQGGLRAAE